MLDEKELEKFRHEGEALKAFAEAALADKQRQRYDIRYILVPVIIAAVAAGAVVTKVLGA